MISNPFTGFRSSRIVVLSLHSFTMLYNVSIEAVNCVIVVYKCKCLSLRS